MNPVRLTGGTPEGPLIFMAEARNSTLDADEVARFAKLSSEWWDANGPFQPLHRINPTRLTYIRDQLCRKFSRDKKAAGSLKGLSVLDIGCGGGGRRALDAAQRRRHRHRSGAGISRRRAARRGLDIAYRAGRGGGRRLRAEFDAVLLLGGGNTCPTFNLPQAVAPRSSRGRDVSRPDDVQGLRWRLSARVILRWLPAGTHQ
jgi:2-polyprenyl-6-hydroxyphenyl methylase/3-demethylubiquinone-9 3-methyltransferase